MDIYTIRFYNRNKDLVEQLTKQHISITALIQELREQYLFKIVILSVITLSEEKLIKELQEQVNN